MEASRPESVMHVVGTPTSRGVTWVWVQEDLDLATVERARRELEAVLAAPEIGRVLVYVGVERFVALGGLRLIVETAEGVHSRGGALAVVAPPQCVRTLVEINGLAEVLPLIATSRDAALWAGRLRRRDGVRY